MKVVILSAQKRGGRFESPSIAHAVGIRRLDEGEDGTDKLIRIPLCLQYSLIIPANMTALAVLRVPFSILTAQTSNLGWPALKRSTELALSINTNPYLRRLADSTSIESTRSPGLNPNSVVARVRTDGVAFRKNTGRAAVQPWQVFRIHPGHP